MSNGKEVKDLSSNLPAQYGGQELITSLAENLGLFSIRHHYESTKKNLSTGLEGRKTTVSSSTIELNTNAILTDHEKLQYVLN